MFNAEPWDDYAKTRRIEDDASDVVLYLDTDDVNPEEVSEHTASRIVAALNAEFYSHEGAR